MVVCENGINDAYKVAQIIYIEYSMSPNTFPWRNDNTLTFVWFLYICQIYLESGELSLGFRKESGAMWAGL